jgi:hypothetical protein
MDTVLVRDFLSSENSTGVTGALSWVANFPLEEWDFSFLPAIGVPETLLLRVRLEWLVFDSKESIDPEPDCREQDSLIEINPSEMKKNVSEL